MSGFKIPADFDISKLPIGNSSVNGSQDINEQDLSALMQDPKVMQDIMRSFSTKPDEMMNLGHELSKTADPNLIEKAKKMAQNGDMAKQVMKKMPKGISPSSLRKMQKNGNVEAMMQKQKEKEGTMFSVVICTTSRALKEKQINIKNAEIEISKLLRNEPNIKHFPELSIGPLAKEEIFVAWTELKNVNKRINRILGNQIGGDVILFNQKRNFKTKDFEFLEKNVNKIIEKRKEIENQKSEDIDSIFDEL